MLGRLTPLLLTGKINKLQFLLRVLVSFIHIIILKYIIKYSTRVGGLFLGREYHGSYGYTMVTHSLMFNVCKWLLLISRK